MDRRKFTLGAGGLLALPGFFYASPARAEDKVHAIFSSAVANAQLWSSYVSASERGVFKKHGLEVEFSEGQGGGVTSQVIANGRADFGLGVAASAVINVNGQGGSVKMVAADMPVAAIAILSKAPKKIVKPQDLVGTTIGIPPGTSQALAWPAFLAKNNVDPKSINVVNVQLATMRTALLQGQVDSYLAYSWSNVPLLKSLGVADPHAMLFSDFGFRLAPDSGIIVRQDLLAAKPDLVKRFVAASSEAWAYALANPDAIGAPTKKVFPGVDPAIAAAQINLAAGFFEANKKAGKPLMWQSPEDWAAQVKTLTELGVAINPKEATSYYSNEFLPTV